MIKQPSWSTMRTSIGDGGAQNRCWNICNTDSTVRGVSFSVTAMCPSVSIVLSRIIVDSLQQRHTSAASSASRQSCLQSPGSHSPKQTLVTNLLLLSYLFIYLFITRFTSHVKSFTKWRIASAGWSQVSVGKPGCKVVFKRDLNVPRLMVRSQMTDWGRLFQTVGTAWQKARLAKFRFVLLSCTFAPSRGYRLS